MMNRIRATRGDRGYSLTEVLVAVGLFVMLSAIVYGVIIQTHQVTRVAATGSFTESQMLDGISRVTRDISIADPIVRAGKTDLAVNAKRGGQCVQTRYQVQGADLVSLTDRDGDGMATPADSTAEGSSTCVSNNGEIIAGGGTTPTVIAKDLSEQAQAQMFTYFGADDDTPLEFNDEGYIDNPETITRVKIALSAKIKGRGNLMTLATSASPRTVIGSPGAVANEPSAPAEPPQVSADGSCDANILISWSPVPDATGYLVFQDGTQVADLLPTETSYLAGSEMADGLPYGSTTTYKVITKSVDGFSTPQDVNVTRCPAAPTLTGAVEALDADGYANDNVLSWTSTESATSCRVYRGATTAPVGTVTVTPTPAEVQWQDKNRTWGGTDIYRVACVNGAGEGPRSNTASLTVVPAAPTLSGTHANGDRNLSWTKPATSTEYELRRRYPANTTWATIYVGPALTFADTSTLNSASFDYQVRAKNASGYGPYSNIVALAPRPAAPVITGKANDGNNVITWGAAKNATGYRVYRDGSLVATLGNVLTWTDTSPGWGSTRAYYVVAFNKAGDSANSNTVTLKQMPGPFSITGGGSEQWGKYKDEKNVVIFNQPGGIYADWSNSSGAASYDVTFSGTKVATSTTTSRFPASGYWEATLGTAYSAVVTAKASNGTTRTAATVTIANAPSPPRDVWGATYCNITYNANGWKFGMKWNNYPAKGYASNTDVTTRQYHVSNPGYKPLNYTFDKNIKVDNYGMSNTTRTTMWGGTSNTTLIGNKAGDGGGYYVENFRDITATYGRYDSIRFGLTGHKNVTGAVACPSTQKTWGYNGNSGTIQRWYLY